MLVAVIAFGAGFWPLNLMASPNDFTVLCYHDVSKSNPEDAYGVTLAQLREQFDFLQKNYHVVSIDDVIAASKGQQTLPEKAVVITFDDGLESFYELVYPLLKEYKFPAVFAVVGKWVEDGKSPDYGYVGSNPSMVTWKQLKEMSDSGLVAVVSHSYSSHYGHVFNPQGNEQAALGYLKYNTVTKSYETETDFYNRVKADLDKNDKLIRQHIGKSYPIMVWPYGTFNGLSQKAATELGLSMQFSIEHGLNNASNLNFIRRGMVLASFSMPVFAEALQSSFHNSAAIKAVRIDVDSVWAGNEEDSNIRLGKLNDKAAEVRPNVALIQTFTVQGEAFFPNSVLPVKANYFSRVAHVLQNRARVEKVYATLPLKLLKDVETTRRLVRDLALYADIDGVFFETKDFKGKEGDELIAQAMLTGTELRPAWSYGLVGAFSSKHQVKFKYIIKDFSLVLAKKKTSKVVKEFLDPKMIVALDGKRTNSIIKSQQQLQKLGIKNYFLPVSFNSFDDLSFLRTHLGAEQNPYLVH